MAAALVGHTGVVDPHGRYAAGPVREGEQLLCAEADLDRIVERRLINDSAGHYARPDLLRLVTVKDPQRAGTHGTSHSRDPPCAQAPRKDSLTGKEEELPWRRASRRK